MSQSEHKIRF